MDPSVLMQAAQPVLTQDEEKTLIEAAQRDPASFTGLYRQYVRPVYRYLYSRTGNHGDAEDLTAQVFLEALEGLGRYRLDGPFAAWLFTIARRRMIDHRRRQRPVVALDERIPASETPVDPLGRAIRNEESRLLRDLLAGMGEADQELLRLRFAGGLSFGDMARILRRSEAAVKMKLYRLLRRLESQMEDYHG